MTYGSIECKNESILDGWSYCRRRNHWCKSCSERIDSDEMVEERLQWREDFEYDEKWNKKRQRCIEGIPDNKSKNRKYFSEYDYQILYLILWIEMMTAERFERFIGRRAIDKVKQHQKRSKIGREIFI